MEDIYAYLIAAISLVSALIAHRWISHAFWFPNAVSALITGIAALGFYALIGRSESGASYLTVVVFAMVMGFLIAVFVGYFLKLLPKLFK